ncbi:MAG TPA: polysaccharide biosynthesis/export family protein [Candidatus Eremiobacteraceae bacterium]|nr:polysaccharide biosynthesis/export family protein [Candidatus Eremiobacteraceae bacterium]
MSLNTRLFWAQRAALILGCALVAGSVCAQDAPGSDPSRTKATPASSAANPPAAKPHDNSFVIGNDDVLAINVWKEPDISRSIPVRSDGKISLPLVGEVQAAGLTPLKLETDIAIKLKNYIAEPEVTVMVQQVNSQKFNILGQVARPGSYVIANSPTVLDAIALAGGFRDFAKQKSIYVLRQGSGGESRIKFNYKEVSQGKNMEQNIKLQPGDTIIVP